MLDRFNKRLIKKSRRGFRGYPVATIACYGPDDRRASKLVVSIFERAEEEEPAIMRKWFSETGDVRTDRAIADEALDFIAGHNALTVTMMDRIIGCPHEEGIDYEGPTCPHCAFWAGRDRWTGKLLT